MDDIKENFNILFDFFSNQLDSKLKKLENKSQESNRKLLSVSKDMNHISKFLLVNGHISL